MFNLDNYPNIISHLKSISTQFKDRGNGWIEIFCPYCNDATRRVGATHGHFNISKTFNYCHCFRCEHTSSFTKFLIESQFDDRLIIKELSKDLSKDYVFSKTKSREILISNLTENILEIYNNTNIIYLRNFLKYVFSRCLDIDPVEFLLFPNIINNELTCGFYNYNGINVCSRYINNLNKRYEKNRVTDYYFFQDMNLIGEYKHIVICEGGFDLINLYNYSPFFNRQKSFYIAINGRDYKKIVRELIANYLLLGSQTINIVFDSGINDIDKIMKANKLISSQLNPQIQFNYFKPNISKDVSEIMSLAQI
jgi:hypothetical protein